MTSSTERHGVGFVPSSAVTSRDEEVQPWFETVLVVDYRPDGAARLLEQVDDPEPGGFRDPNGIPPLTGSAQVGVVTHGHPPRRLRCGAPPGIGHENGLLTTTYEETIPLCKLRERTACPQEVR
ncbi:hypothetical protein [Streptomyces sp. Ru73]|uniref:hypothetical protein n=1 Tax=Streptomyces sp. Ru73 TaxID=2080748 RepID=UPI0015E46C26|nr:hypothetical protein [Streptomyces sp. Ru73]